MYAANKSTTRVRTGPHIPQSESQHRLHVSSEVRNRISKVFAKSIQGEHLASRKQLCMQRVVLTLCLDKLKAEMTLI